MPARTKWLHHCVPVVFLALVAVIFSWPLPSSLNTAVVGSGAGDNLAFVWNFWWTRTALRAAGQSLFWTPDLFAPIGTNLVLHTLVPSVTVWATTLPQLSPVALYNLALIAGIFLNGACTYAAAYSITRDKLAATFAAVAFAGAPFLLVRLQGHLNVLSAWGLPLLFLAARRHLRLETISSSVGLAAVLVLLAYTDYYYAIFGGTVLLLYIAASQWTMSISRKPLTPRRKRVALSLAFVTLCLIAAVFAIAFTSGTDFFVADHRISIYQTFNARGAAWLTGIASLLVWWRPHVRISGRADAKPFHWRRPLSLTATLTAVGLLPILFAAFRLWRAGDYVSQRFSWRSAPAGIDVGALLAGNPVGFLTAPLTSDLYRRFSIDPMESACWLGVLPLLLLVLRFRELRKDIDARPLLLIGGVFLIWSLGPYLTIFGYNTALLLPQAFLKFVPILSNARMPGRAFVVVQLAVALLGAIALARTGSSGRRRSAAFAAIAVVLLDFWPRPQPLFALDRPAVYDVLKTLPPGVVLEVPLGIRDGFGASGFLDHRVLFYQTMHEHPLMGGFVARLSPRIKAAYEEDPVIGRVLALSEPESRASMLPVPAGQCTESLACKINYVVVNDAQASGALQTWMRQTFELTELSQSDSRTLYRAEQLRACTCASVKDR